MKTRTKNQTGLFRLTSLLLVLAMLFPAGMTALAATPSALTIKPITWNVIGLDSNDVNVGPSNFPIGARVCNTSSATSTATVTFNWDDGADKFTGNNWINLRGGTLDVVTLDLEPQGSPGDCADAYFEVSVTRVATAYDKTRRYTISAVSGGNDPISTPSPRELYVEHLISQSRNAVTNMYLDGAPIAPGGTMNLMVGQTYSIRLEGKTATNGYEQIESFVNFPNTIFQVLSVSTEYSADTSAQVASPDDKLYGDGCLWENNPLSPNYRSCLSTGKAGGDIKVTYQVKILKVPGAPLLNPEPLSTLIYDFSGSSYHYNADYSAQTRFANVVNATVTKSFAPKTINPGGTSTLTFTITNPGTAAISDVNFVDNLPSGLSFSSTTVNYSGCGLSPQPIALTVGDTSVSFTDLSVAGNGTCTISTTVTAAADADGVYTNTSNNLFIDDIDTGSFAQDALAVSSRPAGPSSCTTPVDLASWNFASSTTATILQPDVAYATATYAGTGSGTVTGGYWSGTGWRAAAPVPTADETHFQFNIDTSNYGGVSIQLQARINANGEWTGSNNFLRLWGSANSDAFSLLGTDNANLNNGFQTFSRSATTTGTANTRFRVQGFYIKSQNAATAALWLDNVIIRGCPRPVLPTLSKTFLTDPILVGGASTLRFTFTNPNASDLTGVGFSDILPEGLEVNNPSGATLSCAGSATFTGSTLLAVPGSRTISVSGGTMSANATCRLDVSVKGITAGSYTNVSGSITSTFTGPNTTSSGYGTAILTVIATPVISKIFGTTTLILENDPTTTLSFSITNPNPSIMLTGIAFTDTLPDGLVVATPNGLVGTCSGGSITATAGSSQVKLEAASLAAGVTCTVSVNVTGTSIGLKENSVQVTSTNGGPGNTAEADLWVKTRTPALALTKKVSTSQSGPWRDSVIIPAGQNVYYQFSVENTGDVALDPVTITDNDIDAAAVSACNTQLAVGGPLPVADINDDDHIRSCVVNVTTPLIATAGQVVNTAYATGTYNGAPYNSATDKAYYQNGNFGHLPSAYEYMNLFNDGGAFCLNGGTYLGSSVTTTDADGINDPSYSTKSSDDGVIWTSTPSGSWSNGRGSAIISVTCQSTPCYVYAWFDWNKDLDFKDTNESVWWEVSAAQGWSLSSGTWTKTVDFAYPYAGVLPKETYYARFRAYAEQPASPQPNGIALDAGSDPLVCEIEDYKFVSDGLGGIPTAITLVSFDASSPVSGLPWIALVAALALGALILAKRR